MQCRRSRAHRASSETASGYLYGESFCIGRLADAAPTLAPFAPAPYGSSSTIAAGARRGVVVGTAVAAGAGASAVAVTGTLSVGAELAAPAVRARRDAVRGEAPAVDALSTAIGGGAGVDALGTGVVTAATVVAAGGVGAAEVRVLSVFSGERHATMKRSGARKRSCTVSSRGKTRAERRAPSEAMKACRRGVRSCGTVDGASSLQCSTAGQVTA